jgi:hypothetical protein
MISQYSLALVLFGGCQTAGGGEVRVMCGYGYGYGRRFLTREEKIKRLEEYKKYLESEAAGVAERIEELRKEAK